MSRESWFDRVWNPMIGTGCDKRCCSTFSARYNITRLGQWPAGQRILVGPADLFSNAIPDEAVRDLFLVMARHPQHTFKVLTTNAYYMEQWFGTAEALEIEQWLANADMDWPLKNVMLGVMVQDQETVEERIGCLIAAPAWGRFVVINRVEDELDLTDITCPAGVYLKSQVTACQICQPGGLSACRNGRYNALMQGIDEVVLCDRNLDNVSVLWADEVAARCAEHGVSTIRIHR